MIGVSAAVLLLVGKEVAEFVLIDGALKLISPKGKRRSKTMLTLSELNKAAQVRKATKDAVHVLTQAAQSTVDKVKSVAEAAKDAVTGVFPVPMRAFDDRTQELLVLHAGLEQRVEGLEKAVDHETVIDPIQLVTRVEGLFAHMKSSRKEKLESMADLPAQLANLIEEQATTPVAKEAPPRAARTNAGKPPIRLRFDDVPRHDS